MVLRSAANTAGMHECSVNGTISYDVRSSLQPISVGNWTFRSHDHWLPGAKVQAVELSRPGTFAPWNIRPLNFRSLELSLPPANYMGLKVVMLRKNQT